MALQDPPTPLQTARGSLRGDPTALGGSWDLHQPNSWLRTGVFQELILVLLPHHQQTLGNQVKPQLAPNIIAFLSSNSFA